MPDRKCRQTRDCKPDTEAKYRSALELYAATDLSYVEICRQCGVSLGGFTRYICIYHRHLMLKRNGIKCSQEEADSIKISQRGQRPETHAKYKEAIVACDSADLVVSDARIDLSRSDPFMSQHLADRFQRYALRERDRRGEGVPRHVHRRVE